MHISLVKLNRSDFPGEYHKIIKSIKPGFPFGYKELPGKKNPVNSAVYFTYCRELLSHLQQLNVEAELVTYKNDMLPFRKLDHAQVKEALKIVMGTYTAIIDHSMLDNDFIELVSLDYFRFKHLQDKLWFLPFDNFVSGNKLCDSLRLASQSPIARLCNDDEELQFQPLVGYRQSSLFEYQVIADDFLAQLKSELKQEPGDSAVVKQVKEYVLTAGEQDFFIIKRAWLGND